MKIFITLSLLIAIIHVQSKALPGLISDYISPSTRQLFIKDSLLVALVKGKPCPEEPAQLPEQPAGLMMERGFELRAVKKNYCEAARYFHEVRRHYPIKPFYKQSWLALIETYLMAEDFILAINEANTFLDEMVGVEEAEHVHYMVLTAVAMQMNEAGEKYSQEWSAYALGISGAQNSSNPYLRNLTFSSYLQKYPNGKYVTQMKQWETQARNQYAASHLRIGQFYYVRGEYGAAIARYALVLKWGASIESFPEALFETIRAQADLAKALRDPKRLPDKKIEDMLHLQRGETFDRQQLIEATDKEVEALMVQMKANLASNPWTARAEAYLQRRP